MSLRFISITGGIFLSFWIFGLLQERLFKGTFGPNEETFTFVMPLLFISQLVNVFYCYGVMKLRKIQSDVFVPAVYQISIALTFLLAMVASVMALQWVSYPAQVLAKSAKPIPVLIMGVLLGNRSYHFARYVMVILIVAGVCLFMYKDEKASGSEVGFGMGEILLILSLILDGLYNSLQERVMSKHKIKSEQFQMDINLATIPMLGIAIIFKGEFFQFCDFISRFPIVFFQIMLISSLYTVGQFCIYKCITEFGTLTCSIITTTRKFFTVLSSIIIFGHILRGRQWIGVVCVFAGLILDIYYGKVAKRTPQK